MNGLNHKEHGGKTSQSPFQGTGGHEENLCVRLPSAEGVVKSWVAFVVKRTLRKMLPSSGVK